MNGTHDLDYPKFPHSADYDKVYVRDRLGTVWLLVHDGGMVQTTDYNGKTWSAGIAWLKFNYGPIEYL